MNKYEKPFFEIYNINIEDVILTSIIKKEEALDLGVEVDEIL